MVNNNYLISYGGVGEVTGSMHMIVFNEDLENEMKILLDAGGFQGLDSHAKNAYLPGSINPGEIKYIFLTHSHYDHIGRLPILVQRGFEGKIICTPTTRDIAYRMLDDMLHIQQSEIEIDRYAISGLKNLFNEKDIEKTKRLFDNSECTGDDDYPEWEWKDSKGNVEIKIRFIPSEHILGSAAILIEEPIRLLYTGDLGGGRSNLHGIPKPPDSGDNGYGVDYLMIESTYGNRNMEKSDVLQLSEAIEDIKKSGGRLLIPVLAIDRAEEILYLLRKLGVKENVYLDTPMGVDILDIYSENKFLLSRIQDQFTTGYLSEKEGEGKREKEVKERDRDEFEKIFRPVNFRIVHLKRFNAELAASNEPCIILASSGMLEGGRIMGYLPRFLENEKNILLFTSYQAEGSLGRLILDGAKEVTYENILSKKERFEIEEASVDIIKEGDRTKEEDRINIGEGSDFSQIVRKITSKVKCQIRKIEGLSAHADMNGLLDYINGFKIMPGKIFIVHGEKDSSSRFEKEIRDRFRTKTVVVKYNTKYDLNECEIIVKEKVKDISNVESLRDSGVLKFWNVGEKLIAPFAGWVVDHGFEGGGYSLASQEEIQDMIGRRVMIENIGGVILDSQKKTIEIKNEIMDKRNDKESIDLNEDNGNGNRNGNDENELNPGELTNILFSYFNNGYISKGLIKSLVDSIEKGMNEYTKTVDKRIRGRDLILDDIELEKREVKGLKGESRLNKENRDKIGEKLGNVLKRSTKMDRKILYTSLINIRDEIKDM